MFRIYKDLNKIKYQLTIIQSLDRHSSFIFFLIKVFMFIEHKVH
jgi:hypothetical protein